MADAITIKALQDASLDAKSLEEVVNGDDAKQVTTRLGETYPSVKKAIKTLFENGGLPATPFATKALMTASSLPDGKYAVVTNDAEALNGLYFKEGGVWSLSSYNPKNVAISYTDSKFDTLMNGSRYNKADINPISGSIINTSNANNVILVTSSGNSYIKISVSDAESFTVSDAVEHSGTWFWVFADSAGNKLPVTSKKGNGVYDVPEGAVDAYRTFTHTSTGFAENPNINIVVKSKVKTLKDVNAELDDLNLEYDTTVKNIAAIRNKVDNILSPNSEVLLDYNIIQGASVVSDGREQLLSYSAGTAYAKVDVSQAKQVTIEGARSDVPQWRWAIVDSDDNRIGYSPSYGNQTFSVPSNASYIVKTHYVGSISTTEFESITIKATLRLPNLKMLEDRIDAISSNKEQDSSKRRQMVELLESLFLQGHTLKASEFAGVTRHDKIENALKFVKLRGHGIIELDGGLWVRNSAIIIPDNCWLYLNDAELKLADGVFDNLIRNEGIVVNPDPYGLATELSPTYNVRVFGNNKETCKLTGNLDNPYTAPRPQATDTTPVPWVGDDYGWRAILLLLANTKDYKIHDLHFNKSTCWNISQEHGCDNFEVYNLDFSSYAKNGDGVDIRLGCSNGYVHDISGFTADDMVAMTALQGYETTWPSNKNNVYSLQVGGYLDRGFGTDIHDMKVSRIGGRGNFNGVRVLCSGGSQVYNIAIDDITDVGTQFGHALVVVSSGYGTLAKMGDVRNITVDGVHSTNSPKAVWLQHNIKDSYINNVTQLKVGAVAVEDSSTKVNVTIDNVVNPA